jgi:hypothetical protein
VKTILLGPFLSLLPRRWRESNSLNSLNSWPLATVLSGLMESVVALVVFVYWYSYSVTHWAGDALSSASQRGAEIPPYAVGFAALAVMFLHPLTWLICFAAIEGVVRFLAAAFTGNVLGIFPLFVLEKVAFRFSTRTRVEQTSQTETLSLSLFNALRQRVLFLFHPILPDEVVYSTDAIGDVMSVSSSRPKSGWEPPRVISYGNEYYRLEASSERAGSRPFWYLLRRLPAGVPGRTVINYRPDDVIVRRG